MKIEEKLEEKVCTISALKIYKENTFSKNLLIGTKRAMVVCAIPLSLTVAKNVFGIDINFNDTSFVGTFIKGAYNGLSYPLTTVTTFISAISPLTVDFIYSMNKIRKQKYFVEHKDEIKTVINDINILDIENFSYKQLKEYTDKGRSKVLR